jgi:peptidoglycan/xylan/chitin deacetylase (PgdA/CDA1 family)
VTDAATTRPTGGASDQTPDTGTGVGITGVPDGWTPTEDGQPFLPGAPTASEPTGNAPTGNAPTGNAPTGNAPTGNAPTGNGPGSAPARHVGAAGTAPTGPKSRPTGNGDPAKNGPAKDGASLPPLAIRCPVVNGVVMRAAPGTGRTIALTFDDGPGPHTRAILEVLATQHVHATFFVVGGAVAADHVAVTRAAAEGHLIGNHTWDHDYPRAVPRGWTARYLTDQLTRTDAVVAAATGRPTCFFRPPGGFLPPTVAGVSRRLRERVALWSVDPRDWAVQGSHDPGPARTARAADQIYATATTGRAQAHPVVLLHDGGGYRGATAAALPRIIAYYRSLGYRFVRLDGHS